MSPMETWKESTGVRQREISKAKSIVALIRKSGGAANRVKNVSLV